MSRGQHLSQVTQCVHSHPSWNELLVDTGQLFPLWLKVWVCVSFTWIRESPCSSEASPRLNTEISSGGVVAMKTHGSDLHFEVAQVL